MTKKVETGEMDREEVWEFKLYVAGRTPRSLQAIANLKEFCEEQLEGRYRIEVVDLLANPKLAGKDQILATPTLVKERPLPARRLVGDMSDRKALRAGLGL